MDKEEQYTLKVVRLKELEQAGIGLGTMDNQGAFNHLRNFADSVEEHSQAGKQLSERFKVIEKKCNDGLAAMRQEVNYSMSTGILKVDGVPWYDYERVEKSTLYSTFIRSFNKACWQIALKYNLIPKE